MKRFFFFVLLMVKLLNTDAQNVGIGTNSPVSPLTVISNLSGKGIIQKSNNVEIGFYTSNTNAYLQTWSNHPIFFATNNGSATMVLTTEGNLGIGTGISLPNNRLQVIGNTAISGNTGIGTMTPTARLDVDGTFRFRGGAPSAGAVLTSIDGNGNAVWKNDRVAFRGAQVFSSFQTIPHNSSRKLHFLSEAYDYSNSFQATTSSSPSVAMSSFVVPTSGIYHFDLQAALFLEDVYDDFTTIQLTIKVNRSGTIFNAYYINTNCCNDLGFDVTLSGSTEIKLLLGDIVYVELVQRNDAEEPAKIFSFSDRTFFTGRLVIAD